jgi:hypothetical protein
MSESRCAAQQGIGHLVDSCWMWNLDSEFSVHPGLGGENGEPSHQKQAIFHVTLSNLSERHPPTRPSSRRTNRPAQTYQERMLLLNSIWMIL